MKVFLGGTCNESVWREKLIPLLKAAKINFFNPVVKDWTPDCQEEEYRQKDLCDVHLYAITKEMTGVFSIAEAVDSTYIERKRCVFQIFKEGFSPSQLKSLLAVADLIKKRGGTVSCTDDFNLLSVIVGSII